MATILGGLLLLGMVTVSPAAAQRFPGFGGVEGRVGLAFPDELDAGLGAAADLDLGYVLFPQLRSVIGVDYFRAGVTDRTLGTSSASGSLSAIGGRLGLRFDLSGGGAVQPYGIAALTGHSVTVEGDTEGEEDQLDREFGGFVVGASLGAGLTYALNEPQSFRVVAEVRRGWNANVSHWAVDIGLRIVPRGSGAYDPVLRDPGGERVAAVEEDRRSERERQEAAEGRAELERVAEEARRAEQERRDRMTEEQRRQAELETAEARTEAARAEAAQTEAEVEAARARREAELARAEAEAARAEAEAARQQAREAEERLYQSLQDLNRLMTNVTEIRETERGLSVVLGQGLFGVGQSELSARARDEVGRIAAVLSQYPQHGIAVEGHTDSTGSAELNQRLSEQRAAAVRAALVATGIDPGRVDTVGRGPRLPIADNATADGRAQNRRVEIVILGARRPGA